ncbi:MAG: hypothetical protein ONB48_17750 [candidate division KSB1 bacterium]|nr:hypothetical protein [candidate division KSB1 bacterium]MDZ7275321.1 hypothetical protein [candidate division KSB1 bacterium]MDZ7287488.1 hypothetical protein [candidate division KSB1 bacterium]MDZ7299602.1 hypothetical protein [candidate division KSB1 bacterium]MDZ7307460.1 hypothetical protein [candidate division KSB1 bacterium]
MSIATRRSDEAEKESIRSTVMGGERHALRSKEEVMSRLVNSHGFKPDAKFPCTNSPVSGKNHFGFSNCNRHASVAPEGRATRRGLESCS